MGWAAVSVLGFALGTAFVIWLARSNTARWELHHRAARAQVQAREEASLRVRAAAAVAQQVPPGARRLPHPHLPHPHLSHVPHVHLPPRVVDRLAHTREALHRPRLHLPHLHVPHLHLPHRTPRRPPPDAPVPERDEGSPTGSPS